jgi:arginyl-tRNA synthetase
MSILLELRERFRRALAPLADDPADLLDLVRRSQDPRFGDYQANLAMPLGKRLSRPPREVAAQIVDRLEVDDFCLSPEVAGPGFVNLTVRDDWIAERLGAMISDPRLGIPEAERARTYVIDFSAPNVAKPMHVGHVRSTVIGHSLYRTLGFLGHRVISDNHLGDWGTQFGMIIYGYKHFRDEQAYDESPVEELARLYRLVRQLMDYGESQVRLESMERLDELQIQLDELEEFFAKLGEVGAPQPDKKMSKELRRRKASLQEACEQRRSLEAKVAAVEKDPVLSKLAAEHKEIGSAVLEETAKLHAGDEENLRLWHEFVPACLKEIDKIYERFDVSFDHTLGESFYHDRLGSLVHELTARGVARESDGAICVFLEGHDVPMIVRKQDGAFLYATTDLATLRYRMETFRADTILYVVDHRQSLHFEQLFATARRMGYRDVELEHVAFGTVLGDDGRPFKTRAGDTVGLEGLLDEAVRRAGEIVAANDDAKKDGPELSLDERARVAEIVGTGAIVYADLSHNRTSDYVFSYDKMLAMTGNTGTYMQYAYARVRSIFAKGGVDVEALRASGSPILLDTTAERALGLELLRFDEALDLMVADYRPNQLTSYLFEL